jgi:alpha,alpha-trehalase
MLASRRQRRPALITPNKLLLLSIYLAATPLFCQAGGRHILQQSKNTSSLTATPSTSNKTTAAAAHHTTTTNTTTSSSSKVKSGQLASSGASPASPASSSAFPGYPQSAGLLADELQPLLVAIQDAHLYSDSKTAVDLVLKAPVAAVASAFAQWQAANATNSTGSSKASSSNSSKGINKAALQAFVNATLNPAGSDLQECTAPDWQPRPPNFLPRLAAAAAGSTAPTVAAPGPNASSPVAGVNATAAELYDFGLKVHSLWRLLCREVSSDVAANPEKHSLLPLPSRTVVPGDRFREVYYWDSYWVVRGLIVSRMFSTAEGLVDNLLSMLERVGHVPNGARVYYLNRSQPPLLSAMVRVLLESGNNSSSTTTTTSSSSSSSSKKRLLQRALPLLLSEHKYWTSAPKQVRVQDKQGRVYNLSRYWADWYQPRPESYREDAELAANVTSTSDPANPAAAQLYHDLATGAESGWDYSSRWFADNKTLATIRTTQIIPADLNAWLYQMENNIAWMAQQTGDAATSDRFKRAAAARKQAINALLWDNEAGMWRDGILSPTTNTNSSSSSNVNPGQIYTLQQNPHMFASNFVPLWTGITAENNTQGERVVTALKNSGLIGPAGIATTLYKTGQQWDYPNGWPPLQHMLIEGASSYGGAAGDTLAAALATTWVNVNYNVFTATGAMHEKYDVSVPGGVIGGGGEYKPQIGFGWSNGVLLDLLNKYF